MFRMVYLEPRNNGSYRSHLRSDTLWGIHCWAIQLLGEATGNKWLAGQLPRTDDTVLKSKFHVSSAFPYLDLEGKRTHFLPRPLTRIPGSEAVAATASVQEKKQAMQQSKVRQKRQRWMSWEHFEYAFGNRSEEKVLNVQPQIATQAVTHNLIDRRRLGVLTINENGQLYHTNENSVQWDGLTNEQKRNAKSGLYFFISGDWEILEPALRFLEVWGLAGDKHIGKGNFRLRLVDPFNLPDNQFSLQKVKNADARLCLSLYHPRMAEVEACHTTDDELRWQYRLEERQGRTGETGQFRQPSHLFYREGSVFPKEAFQEDFPGQLLHVGTHSRYGHPIYRYGHAFMLDVKIKRS